MEIIPVIDILNGLVVHAKKGERDRYKPLKSVLCRSNNPLKVSIVFKEKFGFKKLYIADLDAITGGTPNFEVLRHIASRSYFQVMLDAGTDNAEKAEEVLALGVSYVVVGTETLKQVKDLNSILSSIGAERTILSLDLMDNKIISRFKGWMGKTPLEIIKDLERLGVKKVILLELSRVGSEEGPAYQYVEAFVKKSKLNVLVGGGVKNIDDLLKLREIGVKGVLLATALHKGYIKPIDLEREGFIESSQRKPWIHP